MGKKLNLYYEQLKQLMSGQPPKTLDEAKQALQAQQQEKAPQDGEARERFDYAQKCNNAIMDCAAEKIRKESAWDAAVKNVRKRSEKPDLQVSRGAGDWLVSMMKTGDDWQDKVYNEVLVAQVAFCTGQIGFKNVGQTYQGIRLYYDSAATYESIQNDYLASIYNAPRQILEELDKKVEQGQRELAQLDGSADAILSGEAGDHVVESAYRTLESDAIDLLLNAKGALEDIKGFEKTLPEKYQNKIPAAELEQRQNELQVPDKERVDLARERAEVEDLRENAEQAGDQFYADLNQEAPAEENEERYSIDADLPFAMEDEEEDIKEEDKPPFVPENNIDQPYIFDEIGEDQPEPVPENEDSYSQAGRRRRLRLHTINQHLDPYGLDDLDKTWTNNSGYTVYENKPGNVNIMRVDEVTADNGAVSYVIQDDDAGLYATHDLAEWTDSAIKSCNKLEKEDENHLHSQEYLELRERLNALRGIKLSEKATWMEVTDASTRFDYFKKSLEKFEEMHKHRDPQGSREGEYSAALRDLKRFAKVKLKDFKTVADHIATKERAALKAQEVGAAIQKAQSAVPADASPFSSPDDYLNFAKKWHKKMTKIQVNYEERRAAAPEMSTRISERDGEFKEHIEMDAAGKTYSEIGGIFGALKESADVWDQRDGAKMKTMLGAKLFQDGVDGKILPEELADTLAKNALACGVVKQLLEIESEMRIKGNPPIKDLIQNGKLNQVVDMVKNSQRFGEAYRSLDLSDASEKQLNDILSGKAAKQEPSIPRPQEVAKDIMKSYLAQQRQARAQNAQQPKHAPVDMQIKGPKQPVLK